MKLPLFKRFNTIGDAEWRNACRAILGGKPLSGYIGGVHTGGYWAEKLAAEWGIVFNVPYVTPCNSATSGLLAACMAAGIGPYDDVWVTNYSMSATAACAKVLGATVTFIDIEETFYGLNIDLLPPGVKPKAIIVTNLFGHPAELFKIRAWCDRHGVVMIEDNAQAPFAMLDGKYAGTIGHIGVFSLNVHKHIQCGEGGVVVTNDDWLGQALNDAINHGELRNKTMVGLNLRMTEVTAAIACAQLKKAPKIISGRIDLAYEITSMFRQIPEVIAPYADPKARHVYYVWAARVYAPYRDSLVDELNVQGFPIRAGYTTPLSQVFGEKGLPVTDRIEKEIMTFEICAYDPDKDDLKRLKEAVARASDIVLKKHREVA